MFIASNLKDQCIINMSIHDVLVQLVSVTS